MIAEIRELVQTIFRDDPAAKSTWEILLCYPGLHAVIWHRLGNALYRRKWMLPARLVSQYGRWFRDRDSSGRDDRAAAVYRSRDGRGDRETAIVGDDVLIYQGVTIGGTGHANGKRHPTIGNGVVVGAGAKVLGNIEIGNRSKIGAGSVVVKSVPETARWLAFRARSCGHAKRSVCVLEHGNMPDPEREDIIGLQARVRTWKRWFGNCWSGPRQRSRASVKSTRCCLHCGAIWTSCRRLRRSSQGC